MKSMKRFAGMIVVLLSFTLITACGSGGGSSNGGSNGGISNGGGNNPDMTVSIVPNPIIQTYSCGLVCGWYTRHSLTIKNNTQEEITITTITEQIIQNNSVADTWQVDLSYFCPNSNCVIAAGGQLSKNIEDLPNDKIFWADATLKYIVSATKAGSPIQAEATAKLNP